MKVLVSVSKANPIVLYVRNVESILSRSQRMYSLFQKMLQKLTGPVLVLGSRTLEPGTDYREVDERLTVLFPYNIDIKPPEDETQLVSWKSQLEDDMKVIQYQDNRNHITEVLAANDIDCDDLGSICLADTMVLGRYIEEIVVSAVSHHLMNNKEPEYRNGKLVISSKRLEIRIATLVDDNENLTFHPLFDKCISLSWNSLSHGLSIFQEGKLEEKGAQKLEGSIQSAKV